MERVIQLAIQTFVLFIILWALLATMDVIVFDGAIPII